MLLAVYDEEDDVFRSISRCMTFTDAMYDATREFYFRGTPYPSSDLAESRKTTANDTSPSQSSGVVFLDNSDNDAEANDEEQGLKIRGSVKEVNQEEEDRVNCFSNRPSSAFVVTNENPPIWLKPLEVWEVSFADMTLSTKHTAAAGMVDVETGRGVGLRFPRFKRRRPDKKPTQATTSIQIAQLFACQFKQQGWKRNRRGTHSSE